MQTAAATTPTSVTPESPLSSVEGIGPSLGLVRRQKRQTIYQVAQKVGGTYDVVRTVENGRGSPAMIQSIADALGTDISITAISEQGITKLRMSELRDYIRQTRQAMKITVAELARRVGVHSTSVTVFESSVRPQIRSVNRYLVALGVTVQINLTVDGEAFVPDHNLGKDSNSARTYAAAVAAPKKVGAYKNETESDFVKSIARDLVSVRKAKGLSKLKLSKDSGLTYLSIDNAESSSGSLVTFSAYAAGLGKNLIITLTDQSGAVVETTAAMVPQILDAIRESKGVSSSEMARRMNTTYRSVRIFGDGKRNPVKSIERYATVLGIVLGHRLETAKQG